MSQISANAVTVARLPTVYGTFRIHCYVRNNKEHVALVLGDVEDEQDVLVRVHSECLTGDMFGSQRCDCGTQLSSSLQRIGTQGRGILIYLRQEGRGIGLVNKLHAYNLQDQEHLDTVDANVRLGFCPDEREYLVARDILRDLKVGTVKLLTNNPDKIQSLRRSGVMISDTERLWGTENRHNQDYLATKVSRMGHLLPSDVKPGKSYSLGSETSPAMQTFSRPRVTLSYAQSVDGSIAHTSHEPLQLSSPSSLLLTHSLRSSHEAILIGVNTLISDNPQLTVRYVEGENPRPVILDSRLRSPASVRLLQNQTKPWFFCTPARSLAKQRQLEELGARVFVVPADTNGFVSLPEVLRNLRKENIFSVLVEGGSTIISTFLDRGVVDEVIVTIAPRLVGGLHATNANLFNRIDLANLVVERWGPDVVLRGYTCQPHEGKDRKSERILASTVSKAIDLFASPSVT